jgi:hypothetical protein
MKLLNILAEREIETPFKKNVWRPLTPAELVKAKKLIFDLISHAYEPIGGHPNVNKPDDIGPEVGDMFAVIDVDQDPQPDAVAVTKRRAGGTKHVAMGHDGGGKAKSAAVNHTAGQLKKQGHYIEVSGKILDILKAKGVDIVDDEETIKRALKGKEIEMHPDGSYDRVIGGEKHRKVMMGKPK